MVQTALNLPNWSVYLLKNNRNYCHQILSFKAKCTKFDFCWGSAPDPARGVHSAPQTPAAFQGSYF